MLNAVVTPSQTTSAESPIGPSAGARSAMIMMSRSPFGPLTPVLHRIGGLEEPVEAQHLQRILQVRHRKVRQQHHGVLVDVLGQQLGVEVVLVQVRDVEVVAVAQASQSSPLLSGKGNQDAK